MADLLLRDTDAVEFREAIVADVLAALRPLLAESAAPRLIDGDAMAAMLSISRPTLDRMRASGSIPSVSIGRRRLYCPDSVVAAIHAPRAEAERLRVGESRHIGEVLTEATDQPPEVSL